MTVTADTAPLSVAQEALWYVSVLDPRRLSYNEAISIRKDGPLDVEALRRAFTELLRRHQPWRTTFDSHGGEPIQVVHTAPDADLPVTDLSTLTPAQAERQAVRLVAERARVPYDLRHGPLVRPRLVLFPDDHHRLYLAMHHLVFDGVSLYRVVLPELIALYGSFAAGEPSPLPEPTSTYADYARWQHEWIAGPQAERRLEHWRARLADAPELALPHDRPRAESPQLRGGVLSVTVPAPVVGRLRAAGQAVGASLFQVLAAAWALLLGRWADQDDVPFATAADLRQRPEFETVAGYCLTPLVLRADLSGDPAFADLVVRVRNELLDGLDNLMPFERLARELPGSASAANPVYQTMLVLEPAVAAPDPAWSLEMMEGELGNAVGGTKLDFELQLDERPEGHLAGRLIYDRDLFDTRTAQRLVEHWSHVVAAVAADPSQPVSRVPLASAVEVERRVAEFNAGATDLADEIGLGRADTVLVLPSTVGRIATVARVIEANPDADGAEVSRLVKREGITLLCASPEEWQRLIDSGLKPGRSLRALSAGGRLSRQLADAILARCRVLWNAHATYTTVGRVDAGGPVTIGRPLRTAAVVDRHGQPAPIGVYGELMLDGADTGDRARWLPDGRLELR